MATPSFTAGDITGLNVRKVTFAQKYWKAAQQTQSRLNDVVTHEEMNSSMKMIDGVEKIDFKAKQGGIQSTPEATLKTNRRALVTNEYDGSIRLDKGTISDSTIDLLNASKEEFMNAMGRLKDEVILQAIVDPAFEGKDATKPAGDTRVRQSSLLATDKIFKDIMFSKTKTAAAKNRGAEVKTDQDDFSADDLESVIRIFAGREVDEELFCTLTPALREILRRDADYKNAESTYQANNTSDKVDYRRDFNYRGINFRSTFTNRLPILNSGNVGRLAYANATRATTIEIACRNLADSEDGGKGSTRTAVATVRVAGELEMTECKASDVVYFWTKNAIHFGEVLSNTFSSEDDLPLLSYAKQVYYKVDCGAVAVDDDRLLGVVLKGKTRGIK